MNLPEAGTEVSLVQIREIYSHFRMVDLWEKIARDPPGVPFCSDGCSLWFDKWDGFDLYPACFKHDLKYWSGYPVEEVERLVADAELMIDVAQIMGSTQMAELMFAGVKVGGVKRVKASFSWGFGRV